jgi:hypothetical protein
MFLSRLELFLGLHSHLTVFASNHHDFNRNAETRLLTALFLCRLGVSAAFAVKLFKSWLNERDIGSVAGSLRKVGMDNRLMVSIQMQMGCPKQSSTWHLNAVCLRLRVRALFDFPRQTNKSSNGGERIPAIGVAAPEPGCNCIGQPSPRHSPRVLTFPHPPGRPQELFPANKRSCEHFSKYFSDAGLKELSDFARNQESIGARKELQKEVQELMSQGEPIKDVS